MVIVSGFNVYPNEVEAVVTACHGVAECACIGVPDPRTGEAVRVYVVKAPFAELRRRQSSRTAARTSPRTRYPKQIHFIDALPKSNVGKILRRDLRDCHRNHHERREDDDPAIQLARLRDLPATTSAPRLGPVDQDRINQFARVTGDRQWIHVDVDRARRKAHSAARWRTAT